MYLARHYFMDGDKDGQGGRKKGPMPSAGRLAKALDLAEAWQLSDLGRYYQAGKCSPSSVMFKGEEEACEVTAHGDAAEVKEEPFRGHGSKLAVVKGTVYFRTGVVAAKEDTDLQLPAGHSMDPSDQKAWPFLIVFDDPKAYAMREL
eukprot:jgi/Tetstr1/432676/TSEL_022044.t1